MEGGVSSKRATLGIDRAGNRGVAKVLCRELEAAEHADAVADGAVAVWMAIKKALEPIIGPRGVAALYHRSLHVCVAEHPWLVEVRAAPASAVDLPALRGMLLRRDPREGATACVAVVTTFCELLGSLIGDSLVERLLAVAPPSSTDTGLRRDSTP